ncbi:hypothetical protein SNE40_019383 [Patella caerulea]|uniref:Uncharacterized protein n=1 Tax=Patella caerulea TaxID=87958 RepID=A0AAN8J736_PATCE
MTDLRSSVIETVDRYAVELNNLSQQIWKNPELAFKEHSAHIVLTDFLEKAGFKVEKHYKIETAFKATFGDVDPSKPHIAVICEYDALPEIGHACGHNLIAEVGIAAGLGIKDILEKSHTKLGQLTILSTPVEESGEVKLS